MQPERRIKRTTSRCPVCLAPISADVVERGGRIWMTKSCERHGAFEIEIARDARFYFPTHGSPDNTGCDAGCGCDSLATKPAETHRNDQDIDRFETLSTCIALIEIVDSCNLKCPTCYAASPWGVGENVDCISFDDFVRRVGGVLERKGFIDVLQLTGGEPTIHPEFSRLLEWALRQDEIGYVLINTNMVRIAADEAFVQQLASLRQRLGKFELYVQFDGPQADGQVELRGADLREMRERAIDQAGERGVPSTLAMVVTPTTIRHLGDALRFGLERRHCRGISLQPMFNSGRTPISESLPVACAAPRPIAVGDVINNMVEQSDGLLTAEDFTPLPCGDPNCHTISYVLRTAGGPVALGRLVDLESIKGFLRDRVDYRMEDLARCGCDSEPLGRLIKKLEIGPDQPFRIFIKPFMDAWTFDQDRIDRCCTHVIRPDGRLDSFCRYYLHGGAAGLGLK